MPQNDSAQDQPAPEARKNDEQLSEDSLESVSGGATSSTIVDGGCTEPWVIPPYYSGDNN